MTKEIQPKIINLEDWRIVPTKVTVERSPSPDVLLRREALKERLEKIQILPKEIEQRKIV